jgi:hypothetical protein
MEETSPIILPGRECGTCSLCCKVMPVTSLRKLAGNWCKDCQPGKGCKIYATRPDDCKSFYCGWLTSEDLGNEWRPTEAKLVVSMEGNGNRIAVHVDHGFPSRWREEPYYSQIKSMAMAMVEANKQVVVYIKDRVFAILPDRDVDLGRMKVGDSIITRRRSNGSFEANIIPQDQLPEDQRGAWFSNRGALK